MDHKPSFFTVMATGQIESADVCPRNSYLSLLQCHYHVAPPYACYVLQRNAYAVHCAHAFHADSVLRQRLLQIRDGVWRGLAATGRHGDRHYAGVATVLRCGPCYVRRHPFQLLGHPFSNLLTVSMLYLEPHALYRAAGEPVAASSGPWLATAQHPFASLIPLQGQSRRLYGTSRWT